MDATSILKGIHGSGRTNAAPPKKSIVKKSMRETDWMRAPKSQRVVGAVRHRSGMVPSATTVPTPSALTLLEAPSVLGEFIPYISSHIVHSDPS
ncbi:hypothetical protein J1N35_014482 [Gossypium stocksii]|uniref:Uncharacterized protein n=1 Tax=Gossypium stocksii TaxID=47602 RepID=A0A9D3VWL1_9ROSI|nr:hypothetical protein J1N35_014482 [Gossypium stocksii]